MTLLQMQTEMAGEVVVKYFLSLAVQRCRFLRQV
jgi:hypothetical protein